MASVTWSCGYKSLNLSTGGYAYATISGGTLPSNAHVTGCSLSISGYGSTSTTINITGPAGYGTYATVTTSNIKPNYNNSYFVTENESAGKSSGTMTFQGAGVVLSISSISVTITYETYINSASASAKTGLVYNGSSQTGVTGSYVSWTGTTSATSPGSYTAYATPNTGYSWSDYTTGTKTITWSIGKQTGSTGVSTGGLTVTYGSTNTRLVSGNTGTVSVSSSNTSVATVSISGSIITVTAQGSAGQSCTINVGATASTYYNAASSSFTVTIGKLTFNHTSPCNNSTYDGNAHNPGESGWNSTYMGYTGTWSATNAGSYTYTVYLKDKTNTSWTDGTTTDRSYNWQIYKATGSGSVTMSGWTYGGTVTNPTPTSSTNGTSNVSYTWYNSSKTQLSSKPTSTSTAGTYYVKATFAATTNYNAYTTDYVSFTISKASQSFSISPTSKTIYSRSGYNTFTITYSGNQGSVSFSSSDTSKATVSSSGVVTYVAAGSATITATSASTTNYNASSKTCSVTCTADYVTTYGTVSWGSISQSTNFPAGGVTLSTSNASTYFTCSGATQTITYASGYTRSGTITYSWVSGSSTSIPSLGTTVTSSVTSRTINALTARATGEGSKTADKSTGTSYNQAVNSLTLSINIADSDKNIPYNSTTTVTATASYTSGSSETITDKSYFSSSNTSVATIS